MDLSLELAKKNLEKIPKNEIDNLSPFKSYSLTLSDSISNGYKIEYERGYLNITASSSLLLAYAAFVAKLSIQNGFLYEEMITRFPLFDLRMVGVTDFKLDLVLIDLLAQKVIENGFNAVLLSNMHSLSKNSEKLINVLKQYGIKVFLNFSKAFSANYIKEGFQKELEVLLQILPAFDGVFCNGTNVYYSNFFTQDTRLEFVKKEVEWIKNLLPSQIQLIYLISVDNYLDAKHLSMWLWQLSQSFEDNTAVVFNGIIEDQPHPFFSKLRTFPLNTSSSLIPLFTCNEDQENVDIELFLKNLSRVHAPNFLGTILQVPTIAHLSGEFVWLIGQTFWKNSNPSNLIESYRKALYTLRK